MITDDLKFGWRQLIKAPGFSITAILTLGLAIGANTAVFSLVDAVLLKSLPYPQPERLGTLARGSTRATARWSSAAPAGSTARAGRRFATRRHVDAAVAVGPVGAREPGSDGAHDERRAAARQRRLLPRPRRAAGDRPRIHAEEDVRRRPGAGDLERSPLASAFNGDPAVRRPDASC